MDSNWKFKQFELVLVSLVDEHHEAFIWDRRYAYNNDEYHYAIVVSSAKYRNVMDIMPGSTIATLAKMNGIDCVGWFLRENIPEGCISTTVSKNVKLELKQLHCCRCNYSDRWTTEANLKDGGFICYTCLDGRRNQMKDLLK